ncbi:MAG: hypothetical protein AAFR54_04145 [Planctomycetota bacterium]
MLSPFLALALAPAACPIACPAGPQDLELLSAAAFPSDRPNSTFVDASDDGRFVLVQSTSPSVVPGQRDGGTSDDLFVVDRATGTARLVSHTGDGVTTATSLALLSSAKISGNGAIVVFVTERDLVPGFDNRGHRQVYRFDVVSGALSPLTRSASNASRGGNGDSFRVDIDTNGRVAAIASSATDLIAGFVDGGPGDDVFAYLLGQNAPVLVSQDALDPDRGMASSLSTADVGEVVVSGSGERVAFVARAVNLVPGFQAPASSPLPPGALYVRNLTAGTTTLVSRAAGSVATAAAGNALLVDTDFDGDRLAYVSAANDLVAGQNTPAPGSSQVYLFDEATGTNQLVSRRGLDPQLAPGGVAGPPILSSDGTRVVFAHSGTGLLTGSVDANGQSDLFVFDTAAARVVSLVTHATGQPMLASPAGGLGSYASDDAGTRISFTHTADDLLAGFSHPGPAAPNSYRRDLSTGALELLSRDAADPNAGANDEDRVVGTSDDGSIVFRDSRALNLDSGVTAGPNTVLASGAPGQPAEAVLESNGPDSATADGIASIGNRRQDLRRDQTSDDGRWVLLSSTASNLAAGVVRTEIGPHLYLLDRAAGDVRLVNHTGDGVTTAKDVREPSISGDGSTVLFLTRGVGDLVLGFDDDGALFRTLFTMDTETRAVEVLTASAAIPGRPSDGRVQDYDVSDDGNLIVVQSSATDLVPGVVDTNGEDEIVLIDRVAGTRTLVTRSASTGGTANGRSAFPRIDPFGTTIVFESSATDLVAGGLAGPAGKQVYAYDVATGATRLVSHAAGAPLERGDGPSSAPQIAADGTIAFLSTATDLVPGYVEGGFAVLDLFFERTGQSIELALGDAAQTLVGLDRRVEDFQLSRDGSALVLRTDAQNAVPGFVDRNGVSVAGAAPRVDLFHVDLFSGDVELVGNLAGQSNVGSEDGDVRYQLSGNGRRIVWSSGSSDVVPVQPALGFPEYNLFVCDTESATTELALVTPAGGTFEEDGVFPGEFMLSDNGRFLDVTTPEPGYVDDDLNGATDVFRIDLGLQAVGTQVCAGVPDPLTGVAPILQLSGSTVAAANALELTISSLPPNAFLLPLVSQDFGFLANPGGSTGNLCINGPTLGRSDAGVFFGGLPGIVSTPINLTLIRQGTGFTSATAGSTFAWQAWYRAAVGGVLVTHLTEARSVTFR